MHEGVPDPHPITKVYFYYSLALLIRRSTKLISTKHFTTRLLTHTPHTDIDYMATSTSSSLGDGLVHLSLEIEDRTKSIELLQQLISDSSKRHALEIKNFEKDQTAMNEKFTSECKDKEANTLDSTKSLIERKNTLDSQIDYLISKKKEAELTKKTKLDAVRKQIAETKEAANAAFKQERALREKAWYDNRVSEIHNLTWKGTCVSYPIICFEYSRTSSTLTHTSIFINDLQAYNPTWKDSQGNTRNSAKISSQRHNMQNRS